MEAINVEFQDGNWWPNRDLSRVPMAGASALLVATGKVRVIGGRDAAKLVTAIVHVSNWGTDEYASKRASSALSAVAITLPYWVEDPRDPKKTARELTEIYERLLQKNGVPAGDPPTDEPVEQTS